MRRENNVKNNETVQDLVVVVVAVVAETSKVTVIDA